MAATFATRDPTDRPWDRRATATLLALVLLASASLGWLVHPWYEATNETFDGSIYLLCAKSLLAGKGYSVLGMPFTIRPPGFSLLLAPIVAWRGLDFFALNLFVSLTGVCAVACLFALARRRLSDGPAFCVALALWLNPSFRHLSNQVMSDVPGLAAILACLLVERWAERRPSPLRDVILGICIGLSAYVRTAAVLLVPAIVLARGLDPARPRSFVRFLIERALPLTAAAALLMLPWSARNALHHPDWPAEQTLLASYSTAMWHADGGDPSSPGITPRTMMDRAQTQVPRVLADLGGRLDPAAAGWLPIALGAAGMAALLLVAIRRKGAPEVLALLSFGLLAVYFAEDWRLVLPIWPIGLLAVAEVLASSLARVAGASRAHAASATAVLALAVLDFSPRKGWREIEAAHRADIELVRAYSSRLATGERLAAPVGWHSSLLLDRPVYNLTFAGRRSGMAGVEEVLRKRAIDAVVLRTTPPEAPRMLEFLESRYGPGERVPSGVIVRIRRAEAR